MVTVVRVWTALRRSLARICLLAAVPVGMACGDIFGASDLVSTVTVSDTLVGPDRPITVTLTAMNHGDAVAWGQGSSSCQLHAVVRVDGHEYPVDLRACTDDLVLRGVAGGAMLTERFDWNGEYVVSDAVGQLPAGRYRLYALAGNLKRSGGEPVRVADR
ncbi:MAG: hypothetical protein PVF27_00015 [Gemmatimonadales bacterium]|jgi:hypothetical protein